MKPQSPMTAIRRKQARGEHLDDTERQQVQDYYAKYRDRKVTIHLKGARRQEWKELAKAQGISLGAWIQQQAVKGLVGNEEALRDLRQENERLRDEISTLRGATGQLSLENSKLQSRLEGLETSLKSAMERVLAMQGRGA